MTLYANFAAICDELGNLCRDAMGKHLSASTECTFMYNMKDPIMIVFGLSQMFPVCLIDTMRDRDMCTQIVLGSTSSQEKGGHHSLLL